MTKGTLEGEYHKYEPKLASRFRPRKLEPVITHNKLVEVIIEQSKAIRDLQKTILELQQEIERLKVSRDLDSSTSSKPPSGDILKKSKNKKASLDGESNHPKRKSGGQPGHQGKTHKGFGRSL